LEENDIISTKERDEYFWYGLPKDIRRSIREDLDMHSKADIPSMKQASKSTRRVVQAMIDDEDDDEQPFSFGVVMEPVNSSNDLEELADAPANYDITPENEELASDNIVQAAKEVVFAEDRVVWAAGEVLAIDEVGRAADGFVRAVDEDTLSDKVMLENEDDVPVNPETVPIDDEAQPIDDEDLAGTENGFAETRRMWKLDNEVLEDDENVPEYAEFLPHVEDIPVVENKLPDLQSAPVAADDALERNDNDLATNNDVPAIYNDSPKCDDADNSAAVKHMLASNDDELATSKDIPDDFDNSPESNVLPIPSPTGKLERSVFIQNSSTTTYQRNFRHFFDHPLPMLPRISLDHLPGILFDVWMEERKLELE
jgi:hypothetical protein